MSYERTSVSVCTQIVVQETLSNRRTRKPLQRAPGKSNYVAFHPIRLSPTNAASNCMIERE